MSPLKHRLPEQMGLGWHSWMALDKLLISVQNALSRIKGLLKLRIACKALIISLIRFSIK